MNDQRHPQALGLSRLMGGMLGLPLRIFGFGFAIARRAVQLPGPPTATAIGPPASNTRASNTQASAPPPSGIAPPPPWANAVSTAGAGASAPNATKPVATAGGESSGAKPVPKKENAMSSCHCDSDLTGCDLKVIQYTIVTVDPNPDINDDRRVLAGPNVISTSDDLTDGDFAAWVIALYLEGRTPNGNGNGNSGSSNKLVKAKKAKASDEEDAEDEPAGTQAQYLRVCYNVMCRLEMPCINYQSQQAHQLSRIARALENPKKEE